MTSSKRRFASGAACALLLLAVAPKTAFAQRTAADIESARQLYNQGIDLRDKGDLKGALEKFRAAHALGNTPITGIELCRAHASLRQPVEAREVCLGVARIAPTAQETPRSQEARNEAAKIAEDQKPKMGGIRLKILGVPKGREATVTFDGVAVPAAALGEARAVNPGQHVVTAKVGAGGETRATLETREGETRDLELTVQPPPEGEAPPPPTGEDGTYRPPPEKKKNTLAIVSFAAAGGFATIGVIGGLVAMSGKSDLDDKCIDKLCGRSEHDTLDSAKTWGTVSTVTFVLAGVGVGLGLVAIIASSSSKSGAARPPRTASAPRSGSSIKITPVVGLGGAGLHGSF